MIKRILFLSILIGLFSGCKTAQTVSLIRRGQLKGEDVKTEIPFTIYNDLIIMSAKIENKEYNFMLDSGAPNVITPEVQEELELRNKLVIEVEDSQDNSKDTKFVLLNEVDVNGLMFQKTAAAVIDLNKIKVLSCMNLDGLLGANLMRHAIWEIDYEEEKLTIADQLDDFDIPEGTPKVEFYKRFQGTPAFALNIDGVVVPNCKIDLGYNGFLKLEGMYYDSLVARDVIEEPHYSYGLSGHGVFGSSGHDTIHYHRADSIKIGSLNVRNSIVSFESKESSLLGNKFLKNFRVIIDFKGEQLYFIPVKDFCNEDKMSFGIRINYKDNQFTVSNLSKGGAAEEKGLMLGDVVVSYKGRDLRNISDEEYCELISTKFLKCDEKQLEVVVLKDGKEIIYNLEEKLFIPKGN